MNAIVKIEFENHEHLFDTNGWLNATVAASKYGRRLDHWKKTNDTKEYIQVLAEMTNTSEKGYLKTKRGAMGGTWWQSCNLWRYHKQMGVPNHHAKRGDF